jgi:hypothetical protein
MSVVQKVSNRVRYLSVLSSPHARKSSGEFYRDQRYHLLPKFPALKSITSGERLEIYDAAEVLYECCPDTIENLHIAVRHREKGGFDPVPPSYMDRYGYSTENIVTRAMNRILSFSKLTVRRQKSFPLPACLSLISRLSFRAFNCPTTSFRTRFSCFKACLSSPPSVWTGLAGRRKTQRRKSRNSNMSFSIIRTVKSCKLTWAKCRRLWMPQGG